MKKYKLIVLTGSGFTQKFDVVADTFQTTISNSTSLGYYRFYIDKNVICTYPIDKTIIELIENVE
jgi:hypothetical protein